MEDLEKFCPPEVPRNEVVFGTYGTEEWIYADFLRKRHLDGKRTLESETTWLTPVSFNLADWVRERSFPSFSFLTSRLVLIPTEFGFMKIASSNKKITVTLTGNPEWVDDELKLLASRFSKAENLVQWVYNVNGHTIDVPLNYRAGINAAYPWIGEPYTEYIDKYLDSEACVLILIGPPGTGKSTLIKNIIKRSGGDAMVAFDEKVLGGDDFFATFMDSDKDILVMEDADAFLESREDGNTMMHRFLNLSDGLISTTGKKIIFSTNLPSIASIDEALLRPGRCFDVLQFRALTRKEAQAVLDEVGDKRELVDGAELTLAQIFASQPHGGSPRRKVGFTA